MQSSTQLAQANWSSLIDAQTEQNTALSFYMDWLRLCKLVVPWDEQGEHSTP